MHRLTVTKEQSLMWNRYQPYRRGIRFFPHIIPIAFPLIFPLGIVLAIALFRLLFPVIGLLLIVALVLFIVRANKLRSPGAAWNSMRDTGYQWQQRFTSQNQQQPYYQPSSQAGQEQSSQSYGQGYNPEQPYYQPSSQAGSQPYGQAYRPEQPNDFDQPQAQYPERMPPMQQ
jgi:hypothetical protein